MQHAEDMLGNTIKAFRKRRRLTQTALSERVGLSPRQITSIEKGKCFPKFETLCRLVEELDIPGNCVFYPDVDPDSEEIEGFIQLLRSCSKKDQQIIMTTASALIEQLHNKNAQ